MDDTIESFEARVEEIDSYFKLLKTLEDPGIGISGNGRKRKIDPTPLKVMKATAFLLVYNMVESTIRSVFGALYEHIVAEGNTYRDLRTELRKIWIRQKHRADDAKGQNEVLNISPARSMEIAEEIASQILEDSVVELEVKKLNLKGNLDARKIRRLCVDHGLRLRIHPRAFGGSELRTVKDQRNALAHGDVAFSECGAQYTVGDLIRIKQQSIVFVRSILRNARNYMDASDYAMKATPDAN